MTKKRRVPFNMKEARDPEFYIARMLMCSEPFRKFYQRRIIDMEPYDGVIIFPESLLSMKQKNIWIVNANVGPEHPYFDAIKEVSSPRFRKLIPNGYGEWDYGDEVTIDDIDAMENDILPQYRVGLFTNTGTPLANSAKNLYLSDDTRWMWYHMPYLFTNRRAAQEFVNWRVRCAKREKYKEEKQKRVDSGE